MREYSRVIQAFIFLAVTLLVDAIDLTEAVRGSGSDPTWETRWRALDPADSAWPAEMSRSRNWLRTLDDPEEHALAVGFYRRERRYRINFDLAASPLMVAVGVLVLAGLLHAATLGLVGSAFILVRGIVVYLRERRIRKAHQRAKASYAQMGAAEPMAAA